MRIQTTPVIAKGGTYNGVVADALAAPSVCWDGTRFVLTCSMWNTATSKWSSIFFTSTDLATWSYVSGSIRTPATYLLGNGGIAWFGGQYWFVYENDDTFAHVDTSTDLLSWTNQFNPLGGSKPDPAPVVNPTSGKLEIWYRSIARDVYYLDSPDGTTWTDRGAVFTGGSWTAGTLGEAHAYYPGDGYRYLLFDVSPDGGGRLRGQVRASATGVPASWDHQYGTVLGPDPFNAWEAAQVFDGSAIAADRGDGRGLKSWIVYAGGTNTSGTDATDSGIGIAYMDVVIPSTFAPSLFRAANLTLGGGGRFFVNPLL